MNKQLLAITVLATICLPFVGQVSAGEVEQLRSIRGVNFKDVRYVESATGRDPALEKAIRRTLQDYGDYVSNGGQPIRYYLNRVDLNGDGPPEVLVYLGGAYTCGSGGCNMLIFQSKTGGYQLISKHTLVTTPVLVTQQRTKGWRDLVMLTGGATDTHYTRLRFNGRTYPSNPSVQPNVPPRTTLTGTAILADVSRDTGIELPAR